MRWLIWHGLKAFVFYHKGLHTFSVLHTLHIDDEPSIPCISFAVFKNFPYHFFQRRTNQYHSLTFSHSYFRRKKKNQGSFKNWRREFLHLKNEVWEEVCNGANRDIWSCSFNVGIICHLKKWKITGINIRLTGIDNPAPQLQPSRAIVALWLWIACMILCFDSFVNRTDSTDSRGFIGSAFQRNLAPFLSPYGTYVFCEFALLGSFCKSCERSRYPSEQTASPETIYFRDTAY